MPPNPSSPGSPEASLSFVQARRRECIGARRCATTTDAKRGQWATLAYSIFNLKASP